MKRDGAGFNFISHKSNKTALESLEFGKYSLEEGFYETAVAQFEKALALDPKLAEAHHKLGCLVDGEKACAHFEKAAELEPSNYGYNITLADALFELKDYAKASMSYQKAFEIKQSSEVAATWGKVNMKMEKFQEAANCFEKVIELTEALNEKACYYILVAKCLLKCKESDGAIRSIERAVELDENVLSKEALFQMMNEACEVSIGQKKKLEEEKRQLTRIMWKSRNKTRTAVYSTQFHFCKVNKQRIPLADNTLIESKGTNVVYSTQFGFCS